MARLLPRVADHLNYRLLTRLYPQLAGSPASAHAGWSGLHTGRPVSSPSSQMPVRVRASYQTLGVDPDADDEEVKAAYLKLARHHHPDSGRTGADGQQFVEVREAFQTIKAYRIESESQIMQALSKMDEDDDDGRLSFKTKAPQHRQYLSNEGVGYGTPSQRQSQYQQLKVERAQEAVTKRRISLIQSQYEDALLVQDKKATRRRTIRSGMERLVDDLIQESMAKGEFKNLPGQGKPLKPRGGDSMMVDTFTYNINRIVINSGHAPDWVLTTKEIRADLDKARTALQHARIKAGPEPLSPVTNQHWQAAISDFRAALADINIKVDRLNMTVPTMQQQQVPYDTTHEVARITTWYNGKVDAGETPQLPRTDCKAATPVTFQNSNNDNNNKITAQDVWKEIKNLFSNP